MIPRLIQLFWLCRKSNDQRDNMTWILNTLHGNPHLWCLPTNKKWFPRNPCLPNNESFVLYWKAPEFQAQYPVIFNNINLQKLTILYSEDFYSTSNSYDEYTLHLLVICSKSLRNTWSASLVFFALYSVATALPLVIQITLTRWWFIFLAQVICIPFSEIMKFLRPR